MFNRKKESQTAGSGWYSSLGFGLAANKSSTYKPQCYEILYRTSDVQAVMNTVMNLRDP